MFTTLISAAELALQLQTSGLVLLDCRHDLMDSAAGQRAYALGHLPGAQFAHLDEQLSGQKVSADGRFQGRHPLPEKEQLIRSLRAWGIHQDTQVVVYDAHGGMFAARLWWLLRWLGHPAVAVLDGGLPSWSALGLPLSQMLPSPPVGTIQIMPTLTQQVSLDDVIENLTTAAMTLVDARANDRYRGENETIDPVGGHIPGARNRFFKDNLQANACFKPAEQLRMEWQDLVPDASASIMQCGSGVTACHNLLALEVAGLSGAALYPGSWSEWCASPERPVVCGDAV